LIFPFALILVAKKLDAKAVLELEKCNSLTIWKKATGILYGIELIN
jgi:hypothetical protein